MTNRNSEVTSNWKLCAMWLNDCECLNECVKQKLIASKLTFDEFAQSLRDGVSICNLLEYLVPSVLDFEQLNQNVFPIRSLCIKNVELYLNTCKGAPFYLSENDLFAPDMLYDLNMEPVIRSLSILSNLKCVQARCNGGFYLNPDDMNDNSVYGQVYLDGQMEDTGNYQDMAPFILGRMHG